MCASFFLDQGRPAVDVDDRVLLGAAANAAAAGEREKLERGCNVSK